MSGHVNKAVNPDGSPRGFIAPTAFVADTAHVGISAGVFDNAVVFGDAQVLCGARVFGNAQVFGNARVFGNADVSDNAEVCGDAQVCGNARVFGNADVFGNAEVSSPRHVLTVGPVGSEDQTVTLWRTADGHGLSVGCWRDHTIDELAAEVQRRAPQFAAEYAAVEALLRLRIAEWDAERKAVSS